MRAVREQAKAAKLLAGVHSKMDVVLQGELKPEIDAFRREHPSSALKKECKKRFEQLQTPWEKKKKAVRSAKASCDKKPKPKTKAALAAAVTTLEGAAKGFRDETAAVFDQLQQEEAARLTFVHSVVARCAKATDVVAQFADANAVAMRAADGMSPDTDLQWFLQNYGPGQPIALPDRHGVFEEPQQPTAARAAADEGAAVPSASGGRTIHLQPDAAEAGGGGDRRSPDWPHVTVLYAYVAQHPDELNLAEDETVTVVPLANTAEKDDAWSTVRNQLGKQGLVPTSYLDLDGNGAA
jgi:hypothetical protein